MPLIKLTRKPGFRGSSLCSSTGLFRDVRFFVDAGGGGMVEKDGAGGDWEEGPCG